MNEPKDPVQQLEKELVEQAIDQHPTCLNWPPSRGPEPPREVPQYHWPSPELSEPLERLDNEDDFLPPEGYEPPAKPDWGVGKTVKFSDLRAARDTQRFLHYHLNTHVKTLGELTPKQADSLIQGYRVDPYGRKGLSVELPTRALTIRLVYPLHCVVDVTVRPWKRTIRERAPEHMSVGWVLWSLAVAYERIYAEHEKYGIWGHSIGDLYFGSLTVLDNRAQLGVGS